MAFSLPSWLETSPGLWLRAIDDGTKAGIAISNASRQSSDRAADRAAATARASEDAAVARERIEASREIGRLEHQLKVSALSQRGVQQEDLNSYRDAQLSLRDATIRMQMGKAEKAAEMGDARALREVARLSMAQEAVKEQKRQFEQREERLSKGGASDSVNVSFEVPGATLNDPTARISAKTGSPAAMAEFQRIGGTNLPPSLRAPGLTPPPEAPPAGQNWLSRTLRNAIPEPVTMGGMIPAMRGAATGLSAAMSETDSAGKPLTREVAASFLKAAGGDKTRARQLAREAGYEF